MNTDIYWKPTLKVHSDCGIFLNDLSKSEKIGKSEFPSEFVASLRKSELEEKEKLAYVFFFFFFRIIKFLFFFFIFIFFFFFFFFLE